MHPGNSGLSGDCLYLIRTKNIVTGEEKKRKKEKEEKKGKKEERNGRLSRLLFLYRLSMYPRMQMQGFVPCHSSFIHKSHSLLNFLVHIYYTPLGLINKSTIRHYTDIIPLLH